MSDYLEISCKHGKGIAAVICSHMLESESALGFIENSSVPGDLQAWCGKCEKMFLEEGEMNQKFREFNGAKLVCETCYHEFKQIHTLGKQS